MFQLPFVFSWLGCWQFESLYLKYEIITTNQKVYIKYDHNYKKTYTIKQLEWHM